MSSQQTSQKNTATEQMIIDELGLDTACLEPAGIMLRTARLNLGLSQRHVADKLHILANQVEALETGNYAFFTAEIFCYRTPPVWKTVLPGRYQYQDFYHLVSI